MDKAKIIQSAITTLMAMFASGNFPAQVAMSVIRKQAGDHIPSDSWSLGNRLLMAAQGSNDARGYKQWQEVGRYVKKGSHAIHIFAPLTKKIKDKDEITGEETEQIKIFGFRPIPVFRYEDTEGELLPTFDYAPKTYSPFFDVAEKLGVKVEYKALRSDYYGRYTSGQGKIELCSEDAVVYYHELAHAVHDTFVDLKTCDKAKKEIVAELSALILCEISGISGYQWQGFKYIGAYCADSKPETVLKKIMGVLNDVEKIVSIVLDATEDKAHKTINGED
ncbi:MAG: hypothetical protein II968_00705 [Selenomonadaceae bacterium]|nr:hypothetical protein [Selenomonadaceae bacterium]